MSEKSGAASHSASYSPDEYNMDPDIALVYYGEIAKLQGQIRAKHGITPLYFGHRFAKKSGFYTFNLFDKE